MCRFLAYRGPPALLADLLYRPRHGLVAQSRGAELMTPSFNADGFGIGWYEDLDDAPPCVIRAPTPAWSNRSAESIALNVKTTCVFAHVRAASPGLAVQETNTHPFFAGQHLFMHNGYLDGFRRYRRRLQQMLTDEAWEGIGGSTDSEHAFAIWRDAYAQSADLGAALLSTLRTLRSLAMQSGVPAMVCNFAVTDGREIAVTRYAARGASPSTLFYAAGTRYRIEDGDVRMDDAGGTPDSVIVASEPLSPHAREWHEVPVNHLLCVGASGRVSLTPIEEA